MQRVSFSAIYGGQPMADVEGQTPQTGGFDRSNPASPMAGPVEAPAGGGPLGQPLSWWLVIMAVVLTVGYLAGHLK